MSLCDPSRFGALYRVGRVAKSDYHSETVSSLGPEGTSTTCMTQALLCRGRGLHPDGILTLRGSHDCWEPPDVGLAPTGVCRVSPPSPIAIGGPFPQANPLPSPPSPSLFPPTPLGSFCKAPGGGGPGWWGGRGPRAKRGRGGGPPSGTWG